ncbi:hypothetical protein PAXRUDRAFT_771440 [Paxillus rubicundulus Ve08.2h10]|uniref:Ubiquitin domain-containing protein DSK2 n=1 Tax=Paxillus rubicundulus Ve08.2h10 TaxID=930991 RepID=A0A0D0CU20_9AGAM|nr:hypothetical protein PAXRUDRAFT_771440 [Paxillus rubicundulus Ve08.2h10]
MSDSQIQINVKGPSELKLQITISTDKTVLELKQAIAEKSDVEADRQRLIYSGKVLKDEDLLSVYKIQSSHTIHMVKGVSRSAASASTQQAATPQSLPTMQAGQNPHDPLTQINGHMGFGAMAGFNPFADMGVNQNDPNMMQNLMNSPDFLQQMSSVMSNPAVLDHVIASNPQLSAIAPQVREVFQSEQFRQMMQSTNRSNPEALSSMLQMSSALQGMGGGPFSNNPFGGGAARTGAFPAPGLPSTGVATSTTSTTSTEGQQQSQQPPPNPFAGFFPPPQTGTTGTGALPNPFDPAMIRQMQAAFGGFGGGFGAPPAAAPAVTTSPEERFQVQLQQLQDMGFTNAAQNVRALLATAGNVHSAIEYILSGGGL